MIGCAYAAVAEHSILRPFASGAKGFVLAPWRLDLMYQDAGTSTPVTGIEQYVRRIYCATGSGVYAEASSDNNRPKLRARYNLLTDTESLATQSVTTMATTYTLSFSGSGTITLSGTATGTKSSGSNSITCTAGTLTLTVSGAVTKADLRVTADTIGFPAYQRVTTSTNYDIDGFSKYLEFNGANCLVTQSIDFSSTDKITIWAGIRKTSESDAVVRILLEMSSNWNNNQGAFILSAPVSGTKYSSGSRGSASVVAGHSSTITSGGSTPNTSVLTAVHDISGDYSRLYMNGVYYNTGTADKGTGNFMNGQIYIGSRGDATFYFLGRIYALIVLGAQSSIPEMNRINQFVNGKARAY